MDLRIWAPEHLSLTPIGMLSASGSRLSLAQKAALALASDPAWLAHAASHTGPLQS